MFYDVMVWTELFMALTVESLVYLFPCVVLFLPMHPFPLNVFYFFFKRILKVKRNFFGTVKYIYSPLS